MDPVERRRAYSRLLVAIGRDVQVLLTGEYWPEDEGVMRHAWDEALKTLELGPIIPDQTTGRAVDPDADRASRPELGTNRSQVPFETMTR